MSLAFEELFGVRDAFQGIPMAGRTDPWILADGASAHGIPLDSPGLSQLPRDLSSATSPSNLKSPAPARA